MADSLSESRPQMFLFGCALRSDRKEFKVETEDDDTEQQLSLKAVCLGTDAEDQFHTVEVEGLTFDGKKTTVPLAVLKPSVLPAMSLGGFEITPPVTFRLQSGSGPVYISGQHFVSVKDSDDEEEENNSSPVKRPAGLLPGKQPSSKKLKMESDDDEDEDEDSDEDDDDDEDDESDEDVVKLQKKPSVKTPDLSIKKSKSAGKQNASNRKPGGSAQKPETKPPAVGAASKSLPVAEIKNKLTTAVKEGKSLPRTEQKFQNYAKSAFKLSDTKVIRDLWGFLQTLMKVKK